MTERTPPRRIAVAGNGHRTPDPGPAPASAPVPAPAPPAAEPEPAHLDPELGPIATSTGYALDTSPRNLAIGGAAVAAALVLLVLGARRRGRGS